MAVSAQQIVDFLLANPNMSDADIASAMATYGVSPADMAKATGSDEGEIAARVAATLPPNEAVLLGDTYVQAVNTVTGSGEDQQVGGIERVVTYKADENKVGGDVKQFSPEGKYEQTTKQQEVDAAKDFGQFLLTAGTMFGLPAGIGEAVGLGTGATANAVGTGLLSSGSAAIGGADLKDIVKAGVIGGGASLLGSTISDLVKPTVDASTLTSEEFNDLINKGFTEDLKAAGVKNVSEFTTNVGGNAGTFYDAAGNPIVAPTVAPPATTPVSPTGSADNLVINAPRPVAPPTVPSLSSVISAIGTQLPDAGTVKVEDKRIQDEKSTPVVPPTSTVPELTVTGTKPVVTAPTTPIPPIVPSVPLVLPTIPPTPPAPPTPPTPPDKTPSIADVLKVIGTVAAVGGVANAVTPTKTTYPIVPVPPEWTPPTTQTTPFQPLTPIDFGSRNLLIGTQWEKFLDPNYGKVPTPTMPTAPASNMSYSNLMDILGSKQGAPMSAGSLSINDIISGIQNQYGQTPQGSMGQKPA